jgi:hypothetical protein
MKLQGFIFLVFFNLLVFCSFGIVEKIVNAGMWWAFFLIALITLAPALLILRSRK